MITNTKFFTNEPERDLYSRFNTMLRSNTQFFDVLVGYFRTSGFFKLYPAMTDVKKIRILVGLNVDAKTIEIIDQAKLETDIISTKNAKDLFQKNIINEMNNSEDLSDIEKGIRTFIEWLKIGKIEMRMYTKAQIHAKLYIVRKDPVKSPDFSGSVITGSSNFSMAGLQNNLEFNVELRDEPDVQFAKDKFEELWKDSTDIKDVYIETITQKTYLKDDITPYEIYLKTIYEFFKEEINSDKNAIDDSLYPDGYMKLQYQLDAVAQAKKRLETYNGVFIADVVGLGKTYICAMLAKSLPKGRNKLIICPPVLKDYWESVLKEFDVVADVESLGKLEHIIENSKQLDRYKYIFIDEAHRFRNANTEGYSQLHEICKDKKVVLISATPINNYATDIENQLYLFQQKHNGTIMPNNRNIEGFFAKLNTKLNKLKKDSPEYKQCLRENSEIIRDKLLRHVLVRRTRKEIIEYYSSDLESQGLKFPKLGAPIPLEYLFDKETDQLFKTTMNAINSFKYARYQPLLYLKNNNKFATMLTSQHNMSGFMKSILIKRLESSFFAFRKTLNRFIESYEKFIDMYEHGDVYISKKVNVYDLLDNGDTKALLKMLEDEKGQHFKSDEFNNMFLPSLQIDLATLKELKQQWDNITIDPKIEKFKEELTNNKIFKDNKIIVFTEAADTANYIGKELESIYGDRLVVFTGASSNYQKQEIEYSFNPKYEDEKTDKYDILITTDVLAEGINLHRSNVLINYDLPWNPTRIMQRGGRINRVGSKHDEIFIFNFFPTAQADAKLSLKDRILNKLQLFHDTLGEDFKYLSDDERVSTHKLYDDLTKPIEDDEESTNPELYYLTLIRKIRDEDEKLFEQVKNLPVKAKVGKYSNLVPDYETISFIRKGYNKRFYKTSNTETKELTFMEAIDYIKADKNDKSFFVGEKYYDQLNANKASFDMSLLQEEEVALTKGKATGNDAQIIKYLRSFLSYKKFTDIEEEVIKKMITIWENGEVPAKITKDILKTVKLSKDIMEAYSICYDLLPDRYLQDSKEQQVNKTGEKKVILSCFMKSEE